MTIEEARALIPPGWVECDRDAWVRTSPSWRMDYEPKSLAIYAIPAPKPEPRRVPMGEMVIEFQDQGYLKSDTSPSLILRKTVGGLDAVANTKWKLDPDAREWVEVRE